MQNLEWLYGPLGLLVGSGGMIAIRSIRDYRKIRAEGDAAKHEAGKIAVEVDAKAIELYEKLAVRTDQQIATMQTRIDNLVSQTDALRTENGVLRIENMQYKAENDVLKSQITRLQQKVDVIETNMNT